MLVVKEKEVSKLAEQLQTIQEEGQKDSAALEAAEQHFRAVSAGLSSNEDGKEDTLAGQMMACKNDMSKADTEAKQVRDEFKPIGTSFYNHFLEVSSIKCVNASRYGCQPRNLRCNMERSFSILHIGSMVGTTLI